MGNKYHEFVQNYSKENNIKYSEAQKIIKEKGLYISKSDQNKRKPANLSNAPKVESFFLSFD